jgi:NAD(P)-dependent dehydrogenase (short-subunit alcohol dehydrogenase family)
MNQLLKNHMNMNGSVARVSRASRRLGQAFAAGLLAAGATKVYAASRDPSKITLLGVHPICLDVTNEEEARAAALGCKGVNLLIHNAGIAQRSPRC